MGDESHEHEPIDERLHEQIVANAERVFGAAFEGGEIENLGEGAERYAVYDAADAPQIIEAFDASKVVVRSAGNDVQIRIEYLPAAKQMTEAEYRYMLSTRKLDLASVTRPYDADLEADKEENDLQFYNLIELRDTAQYRLRSMAAAQGFDLSEIEELERTSMQNEQNIAACRAISAEATTSEQIRDAFYEATEARNAHAEIEAQLQLKMSDLYDAVGQNDPHGEELVVALREILRRIEVSESETLDINDDSRALHDDRVYTTRRGDPEKFAKMLSTLAGYGNVWPSQQDGDV